MVGSGDPLTVQHCGECNRSGIERFLLWFIWQFQQMYLENKLFTQMNEQRKRQRMKNVRDFVACTICGGAWCTNVPSVPPAQGHECRLKLFEVQKIFFILIQAACRRVGWEENGYSCSCRSRRGNCCWCCRLENEANQTWVGFYIFPNCLFSQSITNPLQP